MAGSVAWKESSGRLSSVTRRASLGIRFRAGNIDGRRAPGRSSIRDGPSCSVRGLLSIPRYRAQLATKRSTYAVRATPTTSQRHSARAAVKSSESPQADAQICPALRGQCPSTSCPLFHWGPALRPRGCCAARSFMARTVHESPFRSSRRPVRPVALRRVPGSPWDVGAMTGRRDARSWRVTPSRSASSTLLPSVPVCCML